MTEADEFAPGGAYPLHKALAEYIAAKEGLDPELIEIGYVAASEGYSYSEYTNEPFGCDVEYQYGGRWGRKGFASFGEKEIVDFFNHVWNKREESNESTNR